MYEKLSKLVRVNKILLLAIKQFVTLKKQVRVIDNISYFIQKIGIITPRVGLRNCIRTVLD